MDNSQEQYDFTELVLLALQGEASPAQMQELNRILIARPDKVRVYVELMELFTEMSLQGSVEIPSTDVDSGKVVDSSTIVNSSDFDTWMKILAEEEKTALAIEIPKEEPEEGSIQKVEIPQKTKKISLSVIFSVAALLFIVLFIYVVPPVSTSVEVAVLTDSIQENWSDTNTSMQNGTRLLDDGTPLLLRKGFAELQFDTNARVVIEGPAEFQILAEDRIGLRYGRIYATVPQAATGFSVYTQNAKIIDLGTEFGVQTDIDGDTNLHVIKGKTTLIAGEKSDNKVSMEVGRGFAKKISGISSVISDIPCNTKLFARTFDSKENFVWRGEPINLADIVGGGNGFGTGVIGSAVDPLTGESFLLENVIDWTPHKGQEHYVPVTWHDFIDGVFVPDSELGPVTISSNGLQFELFPNTSHMVWAGVTNGGRLPEPLDEPAKDLWFNGLQYGNSLRPGIFMHSNLGVTFDLEAIRRAYPNITLTEFRTRCGICDNVPQRLPNADFWVLMDGQLRFNENAVKNDQFYEISIPISPSDRFLSLVTTDGGLDVCWSLEDGTPIPIDSDWCFFADPYLIVKAKE
ncbi:MAG: FecR domain-containing protein [Sedimentisphaerales bacterium]|nr:FecR domain-containing protein [Sedimentisphaerales bacterium]